MTPSWVEIVVPESQRELYEQATDHDIVTVSDDTITLGTTRNAVLRMFDERTIVMMDDDLTMLYCVTGEKTRRIEDPEEIMAVIVNTAIMAMDAGVHFFGFFQKDIRQYKGYEPFSLTGWVGGVVGVIDRRFWFAEGHNRVDIDYTMQCLLVDRIIWNDTRYWFAQVRDSNKGGSSETRTKESDEREIEYLKSRWGDYLKISEKNSNKKSISVKVKRRQKVNYD